ncbi:MAG: hypothetical protein NT061_07535 [Spirochaetes bacterium]|nr:hypothetical protein [Spirochaetota bacterium]
MEKPMVLNSCILAGFFLLFAADLLRVKRSLGTAQVLDGLGYTAIVLALLHLAFVPGPSWPLAAGGSELRPRLMGSAAVLVLGIAAIISALLLLWSVFIEIEWIRKKRRFGPEIIIDSGTYGLCRHPGFWWLSFLVLFLGILGGFKRYFLSMILLVGLDFLLVFIQDRYVFPKVFKGYKEYQKKVPFLIPRRGGRLPWKTGEDGKGRN